MNCQDDLSRILESVSAIDGAATREARPLDSHELSELTRLALEAKQILNSELGVFNDFSKNIQSTISRTELTAFGKPNAETAKRIHSLILGGANQLHRKAAQPRQLPQVPRSEMYVSPSRIAELRAIPKAAWDLQRLTRLTEELNLASREECHMATAMLVRAIVDHIPPVFGCTTFDQVSNNLPLAKSVKSSFQRLQGSLRNIADAHLHLHIRPREILPTAQQVDFRQDLDVLLAEVVRAIR